MTSAQPAARGGAAMTEGANMMWMAWYDDGSGQPLPISPHPRRSRFLVDADAGKWEMQHPGKRAEVRECPKKEASNGK